MGWTDSRHIRRLISYVHAAALNPTKWHAFAMELDRTLGATAVSLHGVDIKDKSMISSTAGNISSEAIQSFIDYYYSVNPFEQFAVNTPPGIARLFADDVPDEVLLKSEFYNDWMRPNGDLFGGVGLKTSLFGSRGLVVSINVCRVNRDALEARSLQVLKALEPHISHAFQVNEVIAGLSSDVLKSFSGCEAGKILIGGIAVTDSDRWLAWADDSLRPYFGKMLTINRIGRLVFCNAAVEDWARSLSNNLRLKRPLPVSSRVNVLVDGTVWTIRAITDTVPIPISPAFPAAYFNNGCPEHHIAFFFSSPNHTSSREKSLRQKHGLSKAESEIAIMIAEGYSTSDISRLRSVSVNTVRNQIRAVLDKMNVRNLRDVTRAVLLLNQFG